VQRKVIQPVTIPAPARLEGIEGHFDGVVDRGVRGEKVDFSAYGFDHGPETNSVSMVDAAVIQDQNRIVLWVWAEVRDDHKLDSADEIVGIIPAFDPIEVEKARIRIKGKDGYVRASVEKLGDLEVLAHDPPPTTPPASTTVLTDFVGEYELRRPIHDLGNCQEELKALLFISLTGFAAHYLQGVSPVDQVFVA